MLVFLRKTPEFTKKGKIRELLVLAVSLVWFAGATPEVWVFGEGVDSARGVAAIVACRHNSSCSSPCDEIARIGRRTIALFLLFRVQ